MTTEQVSIDDKNRTIAIFMELYCEKTTDFSNREIDAWYDKKTNIKKYEGRLQYHSDWNMLMGVVEKIERLGYDTGICSVEIKGERLSEIMFAPIKKGGNIEIHSRTDESKIVLTHKSCYQFIISYNFRK